jgi:hypothetical protein
MHHELSEPHGEVARWTKVYARLRLFQAAHPRVVRAGDGCGGGLPPLTALDGDPVARALVDAAHGFAVAHRLPLVGQAAAFAMLLQGAGRRGRGLVRALGVDAGASAIAGPFYRTLDPDLAPVAMLSETAKETAEALLALLDKKALEATGRGRTLTLQRYGEHAPALPPSDHHVPHYVLRWGRQAIAAVHQSVACHAVVEEAAGASAVYGNVDTVLRYLFHYVLVPVTPAADAKARCLIQLLYEALGRRRRRSSGSSGSSGGSGGRAVAGATPLLERFGLTCYGYQMSLHSAKRARAERVAAAAAAGRQK